MAKLISKTYGDALFELALEEDVMDTLFEEVKFVKDVLIENDGLLKLLNNPRIAKDEKLKVIENVFRGRISDHLTGFLSLIVSKGRHNELLGTAGIFEYFIKIVKDYKGIGIAYVTSAVELRQEQKKDLEEKLLSSTPYKAFEVHYNVQKELIGGMVIRIGDRVVDSSIKTKLESMTRDLMKVQLS